jgi:SpoIID/LytB domain protein
LAIIGDKHKIVVGKELEIRRLLSDTHLKSSAFDVIYLDAGGHETDAASDWTVLRLQGSGWGHGVGLCQIGAAVMASKGYDYRQILSHYYPGTKLSI